ncbi:MaoC family dehydratase [Streptomyces alkaliphilus]|uniref:MaoC family dehydratase n=1 Tax=Streptomyces alkaliphilus TaxID=1472722 RepID=UPI00117CBA6E|nr:MaoC/PaaZ C-terminal domain-containing protein [Streptomyces alkaliphilus]MQS06162.1 dehydratase [Streptomyces alkaliphilus]
MTVAESFTALPGTELSPLRLPAVTPGMIAGFARASGDTNPIHLDPGAARAAGLPGVIAHGMLTMALLGRLVTSWAPQERLRSLRTSFVAPVPGGDALVCSGTVTEVTQSAGESGLALVRLVARRSDGTTVARGVAEVAVDAVPGRGAPGAAA